MCGLLFKERCKPGVEDSVATNVVQLILNFFGLEMQFPVNNQHPRKIFFITLTQYD